jgi:hypothetical protein
MPPGSSRARHRCADRARASSSAGCAAPSASTPACSRNSRSTRPPSPCFRSNSPGRCDRALRACAGASRRPRAAHRSSARGSRQHLARGPLEAGADLRVAGRRSARAPGPAAPTARRARAGRPRSWPGCRDQQALAAVRPQAQVDLVEAAGRWWSCPARRSASAPRAGSSAAASSGRAPSLSAPSRARYRNTRSRSELKPSSAPPKLPKPSRAMPAVGQAAVGGDHFGLSAIEQRVDDHFGQPGQLRALSPPPGRRTGWRGRCGRPRSGGIRSAPAAAARRRPRQARSGPAPSSRRDHLRDRAAPWLRPSSRSSSSSGCAPGARPSRCWRRRCRAAARAPPRSRRAGRGSWCGAAPPAGSAAGAPAASAAAVAHGSASSRAGSSRSRRARARADSCARRAAANCSSAAGLLGLGEAGLPQQLDRRLAIDLPPVVEQAGRRAAAALAASALEDFLELLADRARSAFSASSSAASQSASPGRVPAAAVRSPSSGSTCSLLSRSICRRFSTCAGSR